MYSMLAAVTKIRHNIDIIMNYPKLKNSVKQNSKGYTSTKSKVLTTDQVWDFLLKADDREYLALEVCT